jgi:hypothetical protein
MSDSETCERRMLRSKNSREQNFYSESTSGFAELFQALLISRAAETEYP